MSMPGTQPLGHRHLPPVELIGVPFDGMGRRGGQALAPRVLRDAGLTEVLGPEVTDRSDLRLPPASQECGPSGFLNEHALSPMWRGVQEVVGRSLARDRFPLVFGGDCALLFGAVPALRGAVGEAGLVFIDGHEDAYPLDRAPHGEAASTELGLLLGLTGDSRTAEFFDHRLPALRTDQVAVLGPRDAALLEASGVPRVADRVLFASSEDVMDDPSGAADRAARHVTRSSAGWWLHVDLDVLAHDVFPSCGDPSEESLPGGLTWQALQQVVVTVLQHEGCRGWSIAVYNPDKDPDRVDARRVVELVSAAAPHWT